MSQGGSLDLAPGGMDLQLSYASSMHGGFTLTSSISARSVFRRASRPCARPESSHIPDAAASCSRDASLDLRKRMDGEGGGACTGGGRVRARIVGGEGGDGEGAAAAGTVIQ